MAASTLRCTNRRRVRLRSTTFPEGTLFLREVASYHLSKLLGWDIVPPTVVRDGPHGIGSVQLYVEPMPESESWDPRRFWGNCTVEIERLVLFDHIANNADRKLSHCLRDVQGKGLGYRSRIDIQ